MQRKIIEDQKDTDAQDEIKDKDASYGDDDFLTKFWNEITKSDEEEFPEQINDLGLPNANPSVKITDNALPNECVLSAENNLTEQIELTKEEFQQLQQNNVTFEIGMIPSNESGKFGNFEYPKTFTILDRTFEHKGEGYIHALETSKDGLADASLIVLEMNTRFSQDFYFKPFVKVQQPTHSDKYSICMSNKSYLMYQEVLSGREILEKYSKPQSTTLHNENNLLSGSFVSQSFSFFSKPVDKDDFKEKSNFQFPKDITFLDRTFKQIRDGYIHILDASEENFKLAAHIAKNMNSNFAFKFHFKFVFPVRHSNCLDKYSLYIPNHAYLRYLNAITGNVCISHFNSIDKSSSESQNKRKPDMPSDVNQKKRKTG